MILRTPERKIVIISVLGIAAAVVCFGLLDSSGEIDNGYAKLGGAFVGFIATVVVLNRVWGDEDDLARLAAQHDSDFVYDEVVKFLDLRESSLLAPNQVAPLTDYYRARRLGESSELHMHYATTADGIEFVESSTHPTTSEWKEVGVTHIGPSQQALKKEYELTTGTGDLAIGQQTVVLHRLLYFNAFKGVAGEWLETHVDNPTGRLAMIILMPNEMRATAAKGLTIISRNEPRPAAVQPTVMQQGSLVYWAIDSPMTGARYAIDWKWSQR